MGIVIVSSQVGSLGYEIGTGVAQRLNYKLVDRSTVHQLAQSCDSEFSKACSFYEAAYDEAERVGVLERLFFSTPAYLSLFESLHYELASRGDVVIMGRGPQVVLRDIPGILKVRVVAPRELRARRMAERKKISLEEARSFVEQFDRQSKALIESVYHVEPDSWVYDMTLNTATFSPQVCVDFICQGMDKMEGPPDQSELKERLRNLSLAKKVESRIKKKITISPFRKVEVSASSDHVVTLSGYVQDKRTKELAEKIAKETQGVAEVINQLKTTELSF